MKKNKNRIQAKKITQHSNIRFISYFFLFLFIFEMLCGALKIKRNSFMGESRIRYHCQYSYCQPLSCAPNYVILFLNVSYLFLICLFSDIWSFILTANKQYPINYPNILLHIFLYFLQFFLEICFSVEIIKFKIQEIYIYVSQPNLF